MPEQKAIWTRGTTTALGLQQLSTSYAGKKTRNASISKGRGGELHCTTWLLRRRDALAVQTCRIRDRSGRCRGVVEETTCYWSSPQPVIRTWCCLDTSMVLLKPTICQLTTLLYSDDTNGRDNRPPEETSI